MKFRPLPRGVSVHKLALPLLLPSLLSSCTGIQSRNVNPDTPALVFVDGQISESASVITQTQQRIAPPPATPVPVRPAPKITAAEQNTPLPKPVLQATNARPGAVAADTSATGSNPALPALSFTGTPVPVAVLSLSPTRNLTLEQWVRRIIPSGWTLNYENALRQALNVRIISVDTNDQWTRVLNRLLSEQSMQAQIDWNNHAVTLRRAGQSSKATATLLVTPSASPKTMTAAAPKNPFSTENARSSTVNSGKTPSAPVAGKPVLTTNTVAKTQALTGQPVAPVAQGKTWLAPSGTTLREMLMKWAQETRCESGASTHWTVIWPVSVTDYRLDAPLTFRGSFETLLGQMFDLYRTAQKPLYAEASRMQCVVSVTDLPAGR